MLTQEHKEKLNESMKDFVKFLKSHADPITVVDDEDGEEEESQNTFNRMKPKVLDVLLETEKNFFDAMDALVKKHSTLATIEDIEKLTKDILKLCK